MRSKEKVKLKVDYLFDEFVLDHCFLFMDTDNRMDFILFCF